MLSQLRTVLATGVAAGHRAVQCRITGHTWTDMAYPPACTQCGRSQLAAEALAPVELSDGTRIAA